MVQEERHFKGCSLSSIDTGNHTAIMQCICAIPPTTSSSDNWSGNFLSSLPVITQLGALVLIEEVSDKSTLCGKLPIKINNKINP